MDERRGRQARQVGKKKEKEVKEGRREEGIDGGRKIMKGDMRGNRISRKEEREKISRRKKREVK